MKLAVRITSPYTMEVLKNIGAILDRNNRGTRDLGSDITVVVVDLPIGWTEELIKFHTDNMSRMATGKFQVQY